jgi:DNA polymerase III epsilon subunit-like protein
MYLYLDTETTGFFKKDVARTHESQPHLVQVGLSWLDNHEFPRAEFNFVVKPDGWEIPTGASDVHGITTDIACLWGCISEKAAVNLFAKLLGRADFLIAHNLAFDLEIMRIAAARYEVDLPTDFSCVCTMELTTDLCKLPGRYGKYKWPKLIEAHQFLFNTGFDSAHDAMADVRACRAIHLELRKRGLCK